MAMTLEEAEAAIKDMLAGNAFGEAGSRVVIEEFLEGEEASFIVMVDGKSVLPMATSQDHKRVGDKDTGPNTGGMGAYSPAPVVTPEIHERILEEVIYPTVRGMAGGKIVIKPHLGTTFNCNEATIIGNTCLYGATGGKLFAAGKAGERFGVRNSGTISVIEGAGDNACEYMTGGIVAILGATGVNFGAGMTGGFAYVSECVKVKIERL